MVANYPHIRGRIGGAAPKNITDLQHLLTIGASWWLTIMPNQREKIKDALNDTLPKAAPFFTYLFYYESQYRQYAMPRAVLAKLKKGLEVFLDINKALGASVKNDAAIEFKFIIDAIAQYLSGATVFQPSPNYVLSELKIYWTTVPEIKQYIDQNYVTGVTQTPIMSVPLTAEVLTRMYLGIISHRRPENIYLLGPIKDGFQKHQEAQGAPSNLLTPVQVIDNAFRKSITEDCWAVCKSIRLRDDATEANTNVVLSCKATDYQDRNIARAFPVGRYVYVQLRFYTSEFFGRITEITGVHKILVATYDSTTDTVYMMLDFKWNFEPGATVIAAVYKMPAVITSKMSGEEYVTKADPYGTIIPEKVNYIAEQNSGFFAIRSGSNSTTFSPDDSTVSTGPYRKFSTTTDTTAYISGRRKNAIGIGFEAIIAIIGAVTSLLTALFGILISAGVIGDSGELIPDDVPEPGPDFQYDLPTCGWAKDDVQQQYGFTHDNPGIISCRNANGQYILLDSNYNPLTQPGGGPVIDPGGGPTSTGGGASLASFAPWLLLLAGGGLLLTSGSKSKRKKRK